VNFEFGFLKQFFGQRYDDFLNGEIEISLTESEINRVRQWCVNLIYRNIIVMTQTGGSSQNSTGVFYRYTISLTDLGKIVVKDIHFRR
jgi:hypothetical protein